MFTSEVPITEPIESHLNSSSDSATENDVVIDKETLTSLKYTPPKIDELKFKVHRYSNYNRKVIARKKELEDDKTKTMWKSLYYTFFNNNNQTNEAVTLTEFDLRSKFLYNMDKYNKETGEDIKLKKISPLTNIEQFSKTFREKKEDNLLIKIFHKKKAQSFDERENEKEKEREVKGKRKKPIYKRFKTEGKMLLKPSRYASTKTILMDKRAAEKKKQKKLNQNKTLLELNELEDDKDLIDALKNFQREFQSSGNKLYYENLINIMEGKHGFVKEIEALDETFRDNFEMRQLARNVMDVISMKEYLNSIPDKELKPKFDNELEPQNRMLRQVNNLYNKILVKLNPLHQIDI